MLRHCPPIAFLLTGFSWLVLASLLGLAILIGLVRGTPLPPSARLIHAHAALVGGMTQMILGGFLAMIPPSHKTHAAQQDSHLPAFLGINAGTVAMLAGFWLHHYQTVGAAGLLVAGACLWITYGAWTRWSQSPQSSWNRWYYAAAVLALFGGLAYGEMMTAGFVQQSYGYLRLAHIHLGLLGFITLVIVGVVFTLLPAALNRTLSSPTLTQPVLILMLLGVTALFGGFMNSSVPIELAAGGLLFTGGALWAATLFRTWVASAHVGTAASDHLLIGAFFFLFTIILGVLAGVNSLSNPPVMPFGTLHLIAYTHMALIGFMLHSMMGALSHLIPIMLATSRVSSNKKRGHYLDRLMAIMDRLRAAQIGGLSLGTMGLGVLASLTWNVPLNSIYIQTTTWICFGLLLCSLLLFSAKLAMALGQQPDDSPHTPAL